MVSLSSWHRLTRDLHTGHDLMCMMNDLVKFLQEFSQVVLFL